VMVIFLYVEPLFINWRAGWLRTIARVEAVSARTTGRYRDTGVRAAAPPNSDATIEITMMAGIAG